MTTSEDHNLDRTIILKKNIIISVDHPEQYVDIPFSVPEHSDKVRVRASFRVKDDLPFICVAILDPHSFRGSQLIWMENGTVEYDLWLSPTDSAYGCIPGGIPAGEWRLRFDIRKLRDPVEVSIHIYCETGHPASEQPSAYFDKRIINRSPGWYKGELHAHSKESDGFLAVGDLVKRAHSADLDFLSISDHSTVSQWWRVDPSALPDIVLINALEITGQYGHVNLQGIQEWVDVFVDKDGWDINRAAVKTHRQGGLFCVNHAYIDADLGWRYLDLDWANVDLLEIYNSLSGPNNIPQISLWDALLRGGRRVIGVAGTDSHDPDTEIERLGRLVTWVYASELSAAGILSGLKEGNVFVSLGPKMEFTVRNANGESAQMGGRIASNSEPLALAISFTSSEPLKIIIFKDGFFYRSIPFHPGEEKAQVVEVIDHEPRPGFYRIELHEPVKHPDYPVTEWRDFKTIRALGNPIWVD